MMIVRKRGLSGVNGAVVFFDHVLDRFKAGAALRFFAARAGAIGFGDAAFTLGFAEVLADFFVAERVAEADHHGFIISGAG